MFENIAQTLAALAASSGAGMGGGQPRPSASPAVPAGYGYGYNPHTKRFRRPNPVLRNQGAPPIYWDPAENAALAAGAGYMPGNAYAPGGGGSIDLTPATHGSYRGMGGGGGFGGGGGMGLSSGWMRGF